MANGLILIAVGVIDQIGAFESDTYDFDACRDNDFVHFFRDRDSLFRGERFIFTPTVHFQKLRIV